MAIFAPYGTGVNLKRNTFHGDWNYVIAPNR